MTAAPSTADTQAVPTDVALLARLRAALTGARASAVAARAPSLQARAWIGIGAARLILDLDRGRLVVPDAVPLLYPTAFSLHGTPAAWTAYWEPMPRPGWHDLFALTKRGEMRVEGDLHPFMAHLQLYKDLLALPRTEGTA